MSAGHHHEVTVPRWALIGAGGLMLLALLFAAAGTRGLLGERSVVPVSPALESRDLRFEDRSGGRYVVLDAGSGSEVASFKIAEQSFVRSVVRGMALDRQARGLGAGPAFRLTRWADGRLSLRDLATGRETTLEGFGATNRRAFEQLLEAGSQVNRSADVSSAAPSSV